MTRNSPLVLNLLIAILTISIGAVNGHHTDTTAPRRLRHRSGNVTPLIVTNQCPETIYPGIVTQSGDGPQNTGFKLDSGDSQNQTVSADWQGRVWGRTNCSFNSDGTAPSNGSPGRACGSGDCGGIVACKATGETPVTLAEFTLDAGDGQTYYDISLVDGYNVPLAIVLQNLGNQSFEEVPPNLTNPSCVATAGLLASQSFNPYDNGGFLGTNSSFQLPFDTKVTDSFVATWCPWDLQVNAPKGPSNGVYTYPDTNVERPAFDPCYSACAKYNDDTDCCTGSHGSPDSCQPSEYSKAAKSVCPDAYSYAFDDQDSTFIIPAGAGFEVIFCPGGRSTTIIASEKDKLTELQNTGHVNAVQFLQWEQKARLNYVIDIEQKAFRKQAALKEELKERDASTKRRRLNWAFF